MEYDHAKNYWKRHEDQIYALAKNEVWWPEDKTAAAVDSQYMLGESLMVAPVTEKGAVQWEVYLPQGIWYDYQTGEKLDGGRYVTVDAPLDKIPLFVKAGGMLAKTPVVQYVDTEIKDEFDPLTIEVYTGADGSYKLYEDDGISLGYQRGENTETEFILKDGKLSVSGRSSLLPGKSRSINIKMMPSGEETSVTVQY